MKKYIWLISGTICVGLAILGIFLPILPTTPFLLLAAFCYGRGSKRIYTWLVNRSPFSAYIRNYRDGLGIPRIQKWMTIALLWLTIGLTAYFTDINNWVRGLLIVVAIGVTIHLAKIKTRQAATPASKNSPQSIEIGESQP